MGKSKTKKIYIDGTCAEGFEEVRDSFRKNFEEGWEKAGAAFAVFFRGKLVVDLWGGHADPKYGRLWKEDTVSTIFSCTKAVTGICFSMLVDRGHCKYNDKVVDYWPEFGQHGKEEITIEMVLAHRSGLPFFSKRLELADLVDSERMSKIIESEQPSFEPNAKTAYQPLTYGWIADQIFRRIDPAARGVGQFYKEEIADKHMVDLHIGDCSAEEFRLARLMKMSKSLCVREFLYDPSIATLGRYYFNRKGNFARGLANMRNFGKDFTLYNNPDTRIAAQPGVNGIASARALAQTLQLFAEGTLVAKSLVETLSKPQFVDDFDHTIGEVQSKGYGFMHTTSPTLSQQFGHSGVGGQIVKADLQNDLSFAYLTNGMKAAAGEHVFTFNRLQKKLYECVGRMPKFY